ncbi:MAG TPA: ABC transporter ATP-binding protein [Dongiaceae bacterium]|nr:ABC transporter ATP-binding protein [Dongiaceae bacterium]
MIRLELRDVSKQFGNARALDRITLSVRQGEFLTLLGASGCGKSTTLRLIAGLIDPDEGEILLDGVDVTATPVHRRETGMVFQSYALFPHMTVAQNVSFGLKMRGISEQEAKSRVDEVLHLVELDQLGGRFPRQLSGGQQQRVALARAIVIRPKVLLLDEPLSNLDAQLRDRLRVELRELQRKIDVTTIYVTHDQGEALALSDRIVFMSNGRIVEIGTPQTIYRSPQARSTAEFLGIANIVEGCVAAVDSGICCIDTVLGPVELVAESPVRIGEAVAVCLRPEDIHLADRDGNSGRLSGTIRHAAYMGSMTDYVVELGATGLSFRVQVPGVTAWSIGNTVSVLLPRTAAIIRRDPGETQRDAVADPRS